MSTKTNQAWSKDRGLLRVVKVLDGVRFKLRSTRGNLVLKYVHEHKPDPPWVGRESSIEWVNRTLVKEMRLLMTMIHSLIKRDVWSDIPVNSSFLGDWVHRWTSRYNLWKLKINWGIIWIPIVGRNVDWYIDWMQTETGRVASESWTADGRLG